MRDLVIYITEDVRIEISGKLCLIIKRIIQVLGLFALCLVMNTNSLRTVIINGIISVILLGVTGTFKE